MQATDKITGHSLDTTFKHLNMFALIDRSKHEGSLHSSQSSKSSYDEVAESVDTIRLHSVVQVFFIGTVDDDGTLPVWLNRAINLFCESYERANIRIMRKTHVGLVEDYRSYEVHGNRLRDHLDKYQQKYAKLEKAREKLDHYLESIKAEIERRTPESSQTIAGAGGRREAIQTSIFDRTSSASDTGPETPGDRMVSQVSTWGFEIEKGQHYSPISLTHDADHAQQVAGRQGQIPQQSHLQISDVEDDGYDSDREGSTAMTLQPSQRTMHPENPISPDGAWETVQHRRPKRNQRSDLHRTISRLDKSKYSDRAGSYRAVRAADPRLSSETASGVMQRSNSQDQPRGRLSGRSGAEVALTNISKSSPPPARGGGMIQDKRPSRPSLQRSRLTAGTPSYAAAVAGPTRDNVPAYIDVVRHATEPVQGSSGGISPPDGRLRGSAVESLQRLPITVAPNPVEPNMPLTLMPPYPQTPGPSTMVPIPGPTPSVAYQQPYPTSGPEYYNVPAHYSQENLRLGPDPFPNTVYPRMPGTVPVETRDVSTSPLKRNLPHDYLAFDSQTYPDSNSLPASMILPPLERSRDTSPTPFLSLSSPNIQRPHSNSSPRAPTYYPGRPEFSFSSAPPGHLNAGYTSQPMSRDASSQSKHSLGAPKDRESRRPSLAETEPLPQVPFSPQILPTSYQVYRERQLVEELQRIHRERQSGYPVRKSPRLGTARPAWIGEHIDETGVRVAAPAGLEKQVPSSLHTRSLLTDN